MYIHSTDFAPAAANKDSILAAAHANSNVAHFLDGKTIRREIYVSGRLVNFVVG